MKKWLTQHLHYLQHTRSPLVKAVISDTEYSEDPSAVKVSSMQSVLRGSSFSLTFTAAAVHQILHSVD